MKDAEQPAVVMIGGVLNILAGLFNMLMGLLWIWACFGIIPMGIGAWQVITGGLALTGKRVPSHLVASICGIFGAFITFNFFGVMMCMLSAILLGAEMTMKGGAEA
jgi:hypothetical protein